MIKLHAGEIKLVDVKTLKPRPGNRNNHPEEQLKRLADVYKYQGFRNPLIISNQSGNIVCGTGRFLAAKKAGLEKVPVIYQDYESEEQEYAHHVADNGLSLWSELDLAGINADLPDLGPDFDINMLGIEDFTLDMAEKEGLTDEDEVPEAPPEPVSKLGDLWLLGQHRLLCGDSTSEADVSRLMNGEKAETFFTDPPYGDNVGGLRTKTKEERSNKPGQRGLVKRDTFIKNDLKIDWLKDAFEIANKFLEKESTKMVFFKWDKHDQIKSMASCFGEPSALCVWDRTRKASAFFRFQPQHELCFHWGNQADKKDTSSLSNVWRIPKELENNDLHPTVKPIALLEPVIKVTTSSNKIVLDMFGGSGSTLIACEKTNRKCFMQELDPKYIDVIIKRWEQFTGQKARHESGKTWEEIKEERC